MKKFILFVVLAIISIFLIDIIFFPGDSKNNSVSTQDEWYAGGTLHNKLISEWKVATHENKLATCADFVISQNKDMDFNVLKIKANALVTCIDETVEGHDTVDNEKVSKIAAQCMLLMDK
jgi:hypothetical protein